MGRKIVSLGVRLRSERERLGLSQPQLAAIVGATKQTVYYWESGKSAPDGFQLATMWTAGVDVMYVLTGRYAADVVPAPTLTVEEGTMLNYFREASKEVRRAAIGALIGIAPPAENVTKQKVSGDVTMNNNTPGGIQVGFNSGTIQKIKKTR